MAWEKFTLTGKGTIPSISFRNGGQIGINNIAVSKYGLDKYTQVTLHIDREANKVGIQFTTEENEEGSRRVLFHKTGASIPAKKFIVYHELLTIKKRKNLHCVWDEGQRMLVVEFAR